MKRELPGAWAPPARVAGQWRAVLLLCLLLGLLSGACADDDDGAPGGDAAADGDAAAPDLCAGPPTQLNCKATTLGPLQACTKDRDCVFVDKDCCGCQGGGRSEVVNFDCSEEYEQRFTVCNVSKSCKAVYLCPDKIQCICGRCTAAER